MLLLGLGLAGFVIGVARLALVWYGQAKATAVETWLGVQFARVREATARLIERNKAIDAEPPPATDQELQDRINEELRKKP